jgi:hypothetical protein
VREVIGFSAAEPAGLLGISPAAVISALQRARATLDTSLRARHRPTGDETELVGRYLWDWHTADVPDLTTTISPTIMEGPPSAGRHGVRARRWPAGAVAGGRPRR